MNGPRDPMADARVPGAPQQAPIPPAPAQGPARQPGPATAAGYAGTSGPASPAPYAYGAVPPARPGYGPVRSSAGKRLGAVLLDGLLVVLTLGIGWLIWSMVTWSNGQSPAKSLMGMRCITPDGRPAGWGTMFLREIVGKGLLGSVTCGVTSIVSCFMILGSSSQGVWDHVASTAVVDDPHA